MRNKSTFLFTAIIIMLVAVTGCVKNKTSQPEIVIPPAPDTYLNFNTKSMVSLDIDYQKEGCKILIEVYTKNPYILNSNGSVSFIDEKPYFAAYTDNNAKFIGNMELPTNITEVYLCTYFIGLPQCLTLDVVSNKVELKLSDLYEDQASASTKATVSSPNSYTFPYLIDKTKELSTLCKWDNFGKPVSNNNYSITNVSSTVTPNWIKSIQYTLWNKKDKKPTNLDNSNKVVNEQYTNISIAKKAEDDGVIKDVTDAAIYLTFLDESAWFQNTFGYYYYPTDEVPTNKEDLKKYIVFPNVSTGGSVPFGTKADGLPYYKKESAPIKSSSKIILTYFDEEGKAHNRFPAGYTIGWFIISDSYDSENNTINTNNQRIYSNASWNDKPRCIALNDSKTGRVIVGFEDGGDNSYEDMLFFIESDPKYAIIDPDKPSIDEEGDIVIPDIVEERKGTLLFEDTWPTGGDYDMNDVIVEYTYQITFDKDNKVKKLVEKFKASHQLNCASFLNTFAYQVDAAQVGTFTLSDGIEYEKETNSFLVYNSTNQTIGKEFTITREFTADAAFDKALLREYNPYIIINMPENRVNRKEVHLPKMQPTIYVDKNLPFTKDDAYYIDKGGKYPFALDLKTHNFISVTEGVRIGTNNEYPDYNKWVESGCKEYTGWYLKK